MIKSFFNGIGHSAGKFVFWLLLGLLIFIFGSVHALEVGPSTYSLPPNAVFYNNSSYTSSTLVDTDYNEISYDTIDMIYTRPNSQGGYGASLCVALPFTMTPNHLYSFSLLLANNSAYSYDIVTANNYGMLRAGYSGADAINRQNSTTIRYFNSTFVPNMGYGPAYALNYMFSVNNYYDTVCFPFTTAVASRNDHAFYGMSYMDVGSTDGLTQQQLDEAINILNTNINSLNGTISSGSQNIINNQNQNTNSIINNQNQNQQQTNQKLDGVQEEQKKSNGFLSGLLSLFSDNGSNTNASSLGNVAGWLPPGPIDSILNLPLSFLNSINNVFNSSTCDPISLTLPFVNSVVQLPCWATIVDTLGIRVFWESMGTLVGGIMAYYYLLNLYTRLHMALTLKEMGKPWGAV